MIDKADLQAFLGKVEGGAVTVDLLKIGQTFHQQNSSSGSKNNKYNNGYFRLALDMEDCLDRFYGGYYSDWACGGQWNRAYQFVQLLANAFKNAHVEVIAFFDGTLKKNKKLALERNDFRQKTISVLKHIRMIGTPPPKIWWLPPSGIRTTLRNALRSVDIQVAQTVNDHTMEIIEYFHVHKLDGILGLNSDYIISNITKYFSSHDLRLSYKGALETKEFLISKLLSSLRLTSEHLPFVAVFLGSYILLDDGQLKTIYERFKIDASLEFEPKIRKIAEIVRNSPTNDIDEFIKHFQLEEFEDEIKESIEYYQRRGKLAGKKFLGTKIRTNADIGGGGVGGTTSKTVIIIDESATPAAPFASEISETDELARKILNDVSNLIDEEQNAEIIIGGGNDGVLDDDKKTIKSSSSSDEKSSVTDKKKSIQQFIYTLPGEIFKTSRNRHQRGIMDPRIYPLLTRKEIIMPQILEDEQYREIPSIHLFYRPARQMIYAILFNLYHQKYLCSKRNTGNNDKNNKKDKKESAAAAAAAAGATQKPVEIQISEWIWSPQNEYKKPDLVTAQPLPWAVPTIQRLWFGNALEDEQRRRKAFLTIMRSDSPLMLNRGYVPHHMLVMACVLRYIVTSPDRNILTRQELDAFLATAFSPQLPLAEYTQELVLPGVHLRGVYLATLFMQGVETSSLANDACGVPLPWMMTNPWLFFDGKLFHLKLKMSSYVTTLRELCDDHIEIVLKIERFRKAILEDVEHYLLPAAHMDPMYRPGFLPQPTLPVAYNKGSMHPIAATAAANSNGAIFYNPQAPYFSLSPALLGRDGLSGINTTSSGGRNNNRNSGQHNQQQQQRGHNGNNNRKGYQLKVGGIVTGSWAAGGGGIAAAGAINRSLFGPPGNRLGNRLNNGLIRLSVNNRGKPSVNTRLNRNQNQNNSTNLAGRTIARNYGNKMNTRSRTKQKRKDNRKGKQQQTSSTTTTTTATPTATTATIAKKENTGPNKDILKKDTITNNIDNDKKKPVKTENDNNLDNVKSPSLRECTVELQNGTTVLVSELANSICDEVLKEEEEEEEENEVKVNETTPKLIKDKNNEENNTSLKSPIKLIATTNKNSSINDDKKVQNDLDTSSILETSGDGSTILSTTTTSSSTSSSSNNTENSSFLDTSTQSSINSKTSLIKSSTTNKKLIAINNKNQKKNGTTTTAAATVKIESPTSVVNDVKNEQIVTEIKEIGQGDVSVKD